MSVYFVFELMIFVTMGSIIDVFLFCFGNIILIFMFDVIYFTVFYY